MNELEKKVTFAEAELIDLPAIEARIAGHMQGIAFNLLQVGRCLVIAKEANLVPHGKWEEWVRFHTGMSERRAQRLMQAVSIAPEGSHIAALPVSKIRFIHQGHLFQIQNPELIKIRISRSGMWKAV